MLKKKDPSVFFINIATMICAFVIFFLSLEITARAALAVYTRDAGALTRFSSPDSVKVYDLRLNSYLGGNDLYYKGTPNLTYKGEDGKTVSYNSKGYRTKEFEDSKSSIRIACFGESSTWGADCNNDETWPFYLQRELDKITPGKYEVINAGFGSYNTALMLNLLKNEFIRYGPDILILYCGFNEHTGGMVRSFGNTSKIQIFVYNTDLFLKANSSFYLILSRLFYKGMSFGAAAEGDRIAKTFKTNVNEIIRICRSNGINFVIVKQPLYLKSASPSGAAPGTLYSKYYGEAYFNEVTLRKIRNDLNQNISYARYGKTYYYQSLIFRSIDEIKSENKDIAAVDFVNDFIARQESSGVLFDDAVHLRPEGNERLAKDILNNADFKKILRR